MNISIIASTKYDFINSKENFEYFSGLCAGVCYMPNDFETLKLEDKEKTLKRSNMTKISGHHSVFDHNYITLSLENIPKLLAMILNNERMYTTSEKSGRYTKMVLTENEEKLYNKWLEIFKTEIFNKYKIDNKFVTESRVNKLAQENARYLSSIFTPVSMVYTLSYRQLNYIYGFLTDFISSKKLSTMQSRLVPFIVDFLKSIENLNLIDNILKQNNKGRGISLFEKCNKKFQEYFGDVYSTSYLATLPCLAQAQRHRTIIYSFKELKNPKIYIPKILRKTKLEEEWIKDVLSIKDNFPQALMYKIYEKGTYENFILKTKERLCSFAQLEIYESTYSTLKKYKQELEKSKHHLSKDILKYYKTSRCQFSDFICTSKCYFSDGIKGTRVI